MAEASQTSSAKTVLGRILVPLLAIVTALVVSSLAMLLSGTNPIQAYLALGEGAFGFPRDYFLENPFLL